MTTNRSLVDPGLISVVIPTYCRPAGVRSAACSVLAQTYPTIEVVIVADGPDPAARAAVEDLGPRVRYFELTHNSGPAAARNYGIQQCRGEWISFLDDDDLMLPDRLLRQSVDLDPTQPNRMSVCRLIYRRHTDGDDPTSPTRDDIWPDRPIGPGEDLGDYLLYRPTLLGRPGVISLQALILHHSLARYAPMPTYPEHEDWAWLLDVWHMSGGRIQFFWEPLVVYNIDTSTESRSRRKNWYDSLSFAMAYHPFLPARAFTSFISTKVMLKARRAGNWHGIRQVFALLRSNHAGLRDYLNFFSILLLPLDLAQHLWKRSLLRPQTPATAALSLAATNKSRTTLLLSLSLSLYQSRLLLSRSTFPSSLPAFPPKNIPWSASSPPLASPCFPSARVPACSPLPRSRHSINPSNPSQPPSPSFPVRSMAAASNPATPSSTVPAKPAATPSTATGNLPAPTPRSG